MATPTMPGMSSAPLLSPNPFDMSFKNALAISALFPTKGELRTPGQTPTGSSGMFDSEWSRSIVEWEDKVGWS